MKIYLELDETEYEDFKKYREEYKPLALKCQALKKEKEKLMKLIEEALPNKSLIIYCHGVGSDDPASYKLEDKKPLIYV